MEEDRIPICELTSESSLCLFSFLRLQVKVQQNFSTGRPQQLHSTTSYADEFIGFIELFVGM